MAKMHIDGSLVRRMDRVTKLYMYTYVWQHASAAAAFNQFMISKVRGICLCIYKLYGIWRKYSFCLRVCYIYSYLVRIYRLFTSVTSFEPKAHMHLVQSFADR